MLWVETMVILRIYSLSLLKTAFCDERFNLRVYYACCVLRSEENMLGNKTKSFGFVFFFFFS